MAQTYVNVPATDLLINSRQKFLDRDDAAASCFSGTVFPTTNLLVGMLCFRTDQNKLYQLKALTPTWVEIMDLSGTTGIAPRATVLNTPRAFSMTGDVTAPTVNFDGSAAVTLSATLANSGVTAGTYTKVTVDAKGRVTAGASLATGDLPLIMLGLSQVNADFLRAQATGGITLGGVSHAFQVGPNTGANIAFDGNQIQSRNNGATNPLGINPLGGAVVIGNGAGTINLDGSTVQIQNAVGGTAMATVAEAQAGATVTKLMSPTRVKNYVDNAIALSQNYYSGNQSITSGGLLTLSHGLGVDPKIVKLWLLCVVAEAGYAVDDEVEVDFNSSTTGNNRHTSVRWNTSTIAIRYSDAAQVFTLANRGTGVAVAVLNSSWRLRVRAWG